MLALISLLAVVTLSLVISRMATVALAATGMSRESARFQARSALTGAGFTTSEAESVVNHPVRRRIIMWLLLVGSAGVVSVIASVIFSLGGISSTGEGLRRMVVLLLGLGGLLFLARSKTVDRVITRWTERALNRYTTLDLRDYASLLHVAGEWVVVEVAVERESWLADTSLEALQLRLEGVVVLGVQRKDGRWVGAPPPQLLLSQGDTLVAYGKRHFVEALQKRPQGPEGDAQHEAAVAAYSSDAALQKKQEADRGGLIDKPGPLGRLRRQVSEHF